jgi:hypothetical protein
MFNEKELRMIVTFIDTAEAEHSLTDAAIKLKNKIIAACFDAHMDEEAIAKIKATVLEMQRDRQEAYQDIAHCYNALNDGIENWTGGSVQDRINNNLVQIRRIDAAIKQALRSGLEEKAEKESPNTLATEASE